MAWDMKCGRKVMCTALASSYWKYLQGNDHSITCFRELQTFIYSFAKAILPEKVEEVSDPVLVQESNHPDEDSARNRVKIEECFISLLEIRVA